MLDRVLKAARKVAASARFEQVHNDGSNVLSPDEALVDRQALQELTAGVSGYLEPGLSPSRCRYCEAPLVWAVTARGKKQPLDAAWVLGFDVEGQSHRVRIAHHATCPSIPERES